MAAVHVVYDKKNQEDKTTIYLTWLLIVLGIIFRLFHFFDNRSIWMDEVYLSTSLLDMGFKELATQPLHFEQKAPIGFLWAVKSAVIIFGKSEMALRLFPLIGGIASLFIFNKISRHFLNPVGSIVAIGILALAPPLIYHAVEVKQYSTEMLGTLISLALYFKYFQKEKLNNLLIWGVLGALILWFSYSSIFILAGIASSVSLYYIIKKKWSKFFLHLIPFLIWLISFAINFFLFTHKHAESDWIAYWFRFYGNFMPFPPSSISDFKWFLITLHRMLDYPLGLLWNFIPAAENIFLRVFQKMSLIPLICLTLGVVAYMKNNKLLLMILVFPLIFMLLASGLELYPIFGRFLVFVAPLIIIIIAKGCEYIYDATRPTGWTIILPVVLLIGPLLNAITLSIDTNKFIIHKKSYEREVLFHINDNFKEGDVVYIYWNNLPGYQFYNKIYDFKFEAIEGKDIRHQSISFEDYYQKLSPEFNAFKNKKRVWLVYNNFFLSTIGDPIDSPSWYYNGNTVKMLYKEFSKMGAELNNFKSADVNAHLFDLEKKNN